MAQIVNPTSQRRHAQTLNAMNTERMYWFGHWREVSDYFLPRRYPWLMTQKEVRTPDRRNSKLLDSTSTLAVRTLASGMMNGITSPARPWFSLRIPGFSDDTTSQDVKVWLAEVERRMNLVLSESNFYNSMAVLYLEWCTFGTASMAIYEDFNDVIRCYNYPLGEFYLTQDNTQRINRHGRRFVKTVEQLVKEFGIDALREQTKLKAMNKNSMQLLEEVEVFHLIEENVDDGLLKASAKYREVYWELGAQNGEYLAVRPLYDWPCVTPRWELQGDDSYGTSPAMDALGDVKQLQNLLLRRAQGLDKVVSPPLIVDQQLRNRPKALGAGGITYAAALNSNFGAKEAYKVQIPFQELANDIMELQQRIRETCHNNLFNMISQLETVRSATEIDARREEKLIHLGPVLERFYNEGLDPAMRRVFRIMLRNDLFPPIPEGFSPETIDVQYVSILSDAQRAASTVTIERFLTFVGNAAGVFPEAREVPDVLELVKDYAEGLGVRPKSIKPIDQVRQNLAQQQSAQDLAGIASTGKDLAQGAAALSNADVGGGLNALQALMG